MKRIVYHRGSEARKRGAELKRKERGTRREDEEITRVVAPDEREPRTGVCIPIATVARDARGTMEPRAWNRERNVRRETGKKETKFHASPVPQKFPTDRERTPFFLLVEEFMSKDQDEIEATDSPTE